MMDNSIKAQVSRLFAALKIKPMTTFEIRQELDIMEVGSRICDLRHKYGCEIHTEMVVVESPLGNKHRVARYSLIHGGDL